MCAQAALSEELSSHKKGPTPVGPISLFCFRRSIANDQDAA